MAVINNLHAHHKINKSKVLKGNGNGNKSDYHVCIKCVFYILYLGMKCKFVGCNDKLCTPCWHSSVMTDRMTAQITVSASSIW